MKDIILIGMPGSGKSVIGKQVSKRLEREFLDIDEVIEKDSGRKIAEIFESQGEEIFRHLETDALRNAIGGGRVIATGGGVVTRIENREIIKNGLVVFLDRPLDRIIGDVEIENRPLLADGRERLYQLYDERYEKYCAWADIKISNEETIEEMVEKIINEVGNYENYGY